MERGEGIQGNRADEFAFTYQGRKVLHSEFRFLCHLD